MEQHSPNGLQAQLQTPEGALRATRAIWAALLIGQLGFLIVVVAMWNSGRGPGATPEKVQLMFHASLAMLVCLPIGYVFRSQKYKSGWQIDAVVPTAYFIGNLVLLALCEAVSLFGLVVTALNGSLWPTILPSVIAMGAQAINFPHGRPMQPSGGPRW